jgi:AraC family transcriptional regulator
MSDALRIAHGGFGRVALLDMDRSLVRHAHPHCHVLLKVDGDDTQFLVGDRVAPLTDDLAVLVNAWETHAYVHDARRQNAIILALYIEPDWLKAFRPNWGASGTPGFFEHSTGEVTAAIRKLALELAAEMVYEPGAMRIQERLLSDLMIAVIERFTPWRSVGASLSELARSQSVDWRVRKAIGLMRSDPTADLSVCRLAREAGLSRAHFFRVFEESTGVTPHVFLNVLKVELAVGAVVGGDESFASIGERLGFSAPAHFTRFFRDHAGVAPSTFRSVARLGH